MIGIGWRRNLKGLLENCNGLVQCLELIPDHFMEADEQAVAALHDRFPLCLHGLSCSLATPGPLNEEYVSEFTRIARLSRPQWVSEHIAFTHAGGIDLGHLNPVAPTAENLKVVVEHARELRNRLELPLLLENITSSMRLEGEMSETQFITEICMQSGCGLLLDVTNLFINAHNHRFDAVEWLAGIPAELVQQLHVVGYSLEEDGRLADGHSQRLQPKLLELIAYVMEHFNPRAVILERDDSQARPDEIRAELEVLHALG